MWITGKQEAKEAPKYMAKIKVLIVDDSAVVRAVLIEHEKVLAAYAERHKMNWSRISIKP